MVRSTPTLEILIATYAGNIPDVRTNLPRIVEAAEKNLPFVRWKITLAYNGKPPSAWSEIRALVKPFRHVRVTHVQKPGKGNAVLNGFLASKATYMAYMDADLATNLDGLAPLISNVMDGADLVSGSRYHSDSTIKRDFMRWFISRVYTGILLKLFLGARFTDPQCGFKAFNRERFIPIIRQTQDAWFFFETEFTYLAQRAGLRIVEIPITWNEGTNSSVKVIPTVINFLKNIARVRHATTHPPSPPWEEKVEDIQDAPFAN